MGKIRRTEKKGENVCVLHTKRESKRQRGHTSLGFWMPHCGIKISWGRAWKHHISVLREVSSCGVRSCSVLIFECMDFYIRGNNNWPQEVLFQIFGIKSIPRAVHFAYDMCSWNTWRNCFCAWSQSRQNKQGWSCTTCFYLKHSLSSRNGIFFCLKWVEFHYIPFESLLKFFHAILFFYFNFN